MLWRSVFACLVLCAVAESQNRGSTKATIQPSTRNTARTPTPVIRVNYKSVKRSSIVGATSQNETANTVTTESGTTTGRGSSSSRNR